MVVKGTTIKRKRRRFDEALYRVDSHRRIKWMRDALSGRAVNRRSALAGSREEEFEFIRRDAGGIFQRVGIDVLENLGASRQTPEAFAFTDRDGDIRLVRRGPSAKNSVNEIKGPPVLANLHVEIHTPRRLFRNAFHNLNAGHGAAGKSSLVNC